MLRSSPAASLRRLGLAGLPLSLAIAATGFGCSGLIEETGAKPDAGSFAPPPIDDDAALPDPPDAAPPLREVNSAITVDLGFAAAGDTVFLNVPAGALGFNIVVESDSPAFVGIERITSPTGEVVHDAYTPKGGSHATSESSFGSIASASVPQSEAKAANRPQAGMWAITVGSGGSTEPPPPPPPLDAGGGGGGGGPATFHVEARIQIGHSTGFIGGRLDMRVFVPPQLKLDKRSLDATSAATDEGIARRLDAFYDALEKYVGIDRGEITFHPVPSRLRVVDDEALLVDAFGSSKGRPDQQALNIMLTNAIDFGEGNAAWGIAPGIPGAAVKSGSPMSGIVLAVGDTPAIGDGLTILHEAGHFIGLNHTTEFYGGLADPLSDTPKCVDISIDDPLSLDKCPDGSNIMFPAFYGAVGTAIDVSEAQRAIYRGSPFYKTYKDVDTTGGVGGMGGSSSSGGMPQGSIRGTAPFAIRPGEQTTLTKSGRALTPIEAWLSTSLCGHPSHGKLDANGLVRGDAARRTKAVAALRAAATSADLPDVMRRKAAGALRSLGQ